MLSDGSMGFCYGRSPVGAGDDVEELAGEVFCDSFYVGVDDGLFAGSGFGVLEVLWVIFGESVSQTALDLVLSSLSTLVTIPSGSICR